jgi:UDP-3-O-[3-hydroxymyristoyl] glucosamine N-acyltransferase
MKLSEIAREIGAKLEGEDVEITGVAPISEAGPTHLTFVANPAYTPQVKTTRAAAVILSPDFGPCPRPSLRHPNPYLAFARALALFYQPPAPSPGIHPTAVIHPSTQIGIGVSIGAHTVIEQDCLIGDKAVIYPNCTIYQSVVIGRDSTIHANCSIREYCTLGQRVILQNGVCIGSDGFGFAQQPDGSWYKIVQSGRVVIEDDVEIGANTTIDRAAMGETRIKSGAKIDNLVQVGHSCYVGEHSLLCAQVGLAGSTRVGQRVLLAGQVGVAGHLTIGEGAVVTAQSGIHQSVPPEQTVSGYPAIENIQWLKASAVFRRLPELTRHLRHLESRIKQLEEPHLK